MDYQLDVPMSDLPNVPSFDPNDLNKSPNEVAGTSAASREMEVIEHEQTPRSDTDTDTSTKSIVMTERGAVLSQKVDVPRFLKDFRSEIPGYIMYVNDNDSTLRMFRTFNELTEYVVDITSSNSRRTPDLDVAVSDILNTPLNSVNHQLTIGKYLRYLYMSDLLTDVRISVGGETFMAHRVVLCCHSDYLAELFFKSKRCKLPFELRINGIGAEAFASFLEFIYTGELTIVPTTAADLLLLADYLRVRGLQRRRNLLTNNLPLEKIVKMVAHARDTIPNHVFDSLVQIIMANFSDAVQTKFFFEIDLDTICSLLASADLVVASEFEVYKTAVDWVYFDLHHRACHTERLLSHVRFSHMSQRELFTCVDMNSLVRETERCHGALTVANWILTSRLLGRPEPFGFAAAPPRHCYRTTKVKVPTVKPRQLYNIPVYEPPPPPPPPPPTPTVSIPPPLMTSTPVTSPLKPRLKPVGKPILVPSAMQKMTSPVPKSVDILVVGGFQADIEMPEPQSGKDKWVHYCQLPEPKQNHAVTLLSGKLYLIGGCKPAEDAESLTPTKQVFAMAVDDKCWYRVADMIDARSSHSACALNGKVYAIGGRGTYNRVLSSVECYSPAADTWSYVNFLSVPRFAAAATCLDGIIYVAGGLGEHESGRYKVPVLSDVEMYDPATNGWSKKNELRFPRCNAALVNAGGRLYLCGGMTHAPDSKGGALLVSVAALDEYVTKPDIWCHTTDLAIPRHDAGVAVAGPRIYIIGGVSTTTDRVLQSVECYDTCACTWLSGLKDLPVPSRHIRCASMVSEWRQS